MHKGFNFVYTRHVVAAVETADGRILRAFVWKEPIGVFHLCTLNRRSSSTCINNQDKLSPSALLLFETSLLMEKSSGMPCGACREFLRELDAENRHLEFMVDYESRKTITRRADASLVGRRTASSGRENKGNE